MSGCELTPAGQELVDWYVDLVREGVYAPNAYALEDNGGFYLLGRGNHRVVYHQSPSADPPVLTADDCVVKLGKSDDPWANRNEVINHEFLPPAVTKHLAPVLGHSPDGQWLIMRYGKGGVTADEAERVEEQINQQGYAMDDIRPQNMAYIGGEPKIIDYGFRAIKNSTDLPDEYRDGPQERVGPPGDEYFEQSIHEKNMDGWFG